MPSERDPARPPTEPPAPPPARPRISGRGRWLGGIVAVAATIAVGVLAWWLVNRPAALPGGAAGAASAASATALGGPPGGPGGPGGGGRPRRRARRCCDHGRRRRGDDDEPAGDDRRARHRHAAGRATVRPQVSGVLTQVLFTRGPDGAQGRSCWRRSTRGRSRWRCSRRSARACATRRSWRTRALTLRALPHPAAAGLDRAPGGRHAGRARSSSSKARSSIDRANEGTARLNLGYTRIVAPVAGRVGLRTVDVGNMVATGDANGVAVITQLAPIDVEFAVPQDRVPEIQARVAKGGDAAGRRVRPHAHHDARRRQLLDPRQPDRHADRHGAGEGALRQRRRRAVPEPVRQRAAAAAHRSRTRSSCR